MKAAILAGGLATRLQGVVDDRPKCLVEINGRPFLWHLLRRVRDAGFVQAVMLVGHRSEQIAAYLGNGSAFGLDVAYTVEPAPLGTAGALKHAEALLPEPFLLLNGDTLIDMDLASLRDAHASDTERAGTMALCRMADASTYGSVVTGPSGRVERFEEKRPEAAPGLVNAGAYVMSPKVFEYIPSGGPCSVERDLLPALLTHGEKVLGLVFEGEFVDIGTVDRLTKATRHRLFGGASG